MHSSVSCARSKSRRQDAVGGSHRLLLRDSGRLIWAPSYSSHEHLAAVGNLAGIGARLVHAFPNGFREERGTVVMDLLVPSGPLAESLRDPRPRPWGRKEALLGEACPLSKGVVKGVFKGVYKGVLKEVFKGVLRCF